MADTMTMRERIARALCEADGEDANDVVHSISDDAPLPAWHPYLRNADAILSELEKPTDEMIAAHAKCEANEFDKRPFDQLGRADRQRYSDRSASAFTAAIRAARERK